MVSSIEILTFFYGTLVVPRHRGCTTPQWRFCARLLADWKDSLEDDQRSMWRVVLRLRCPLCARKNELGGLWLERLRSTAYPGERRE
jgi:hypothetical protein